MKNFEEQYTAWLDDAMTADERAAFERGLPDLEDARRERGEWGRLRTMMRESLAGARMPHADFVNSEVLRQIAREERAAEPAAPRLSGLFPIRRLAFLGSGLVALSVALALVMLPRNNGMPEGAQAISRILAAHTADPALHSYAFQAPEGGAAVLWIDNPGFIAADEQLY